MLNGPKGGNKKPPDLRKRGDDPSIMDRLKGVVDKVAGTGKKPLREPKPRKRSMPRPRLKTKKGEEKHRLTPPPRKPPERRGITPRIPEEDQRTLVGAIVFGIILIILVASGYYFLVYQPYQQTLNNAKATKIAEVEAYFKGPLATDPHRHALLADIESGTTPDEVLAIDVLGPATKAWRRYQSQQLKAKKDRFDRVMIVYSTEPATINQTETKKKRAIMKVSDAQKIINQADAKILSNMEIQTPDTVAVPIMISRLQAAGGLISVGNMVDIYLNVNETGGGGGNVTQGNISQTRAAQAGNTPKISGATILAILRSKESGAIDATLLRSRRTTVDSTTSQNELERKSSTDVEQLLRATAAGGLSEEDIDAILQNYGIRLSDYERAANLGELDTRYIVILEVPRDDVVFLIQNMNNIILTLPTQNAPDWMVRELHKIYG